MRRILTIISCLSALMLTAECGTARKAGRLHQQNIGAMLALPSEEPAVPVIASDMPVLDSETEERAEFQGHDVVVMNAIRDEASGEMLANETLQAARVTARFRNVAERHGRVDIAFQIIVPAAMQDSRWQIRFHPRMEILEEVVELDDILVTGRDYRKAQLRGYQQYERFLRSIITDSTRFIDRHQLEVFLRRNIPELYALHSDTSFVSDERFASIYGVTAQQAVEHYTRGLLVRRNERRIRDKDKMFRKYVKAPIQTGRLRLDTLMVNDAGEFVYEYVQTVETRPRLRKLDILLSGEVFEQDLVVYKVPESEPLTFYISSLSAFVDGRERYLDAVISRRVDVEDRARLQFALGDDGIRPELGDNDTEIGRIKAVLASLLSEDQLVLDSIVVTAHASPEGSWHFNSELSKRRSRSVSRYFSDYMRRCRDSVIRAEGVHMDLTGNISSTSRLEIPFNSHAVPENWHMLDSLVRRDAFLTDAQKEAYMAHASEQDPDKREQAMRADDSYPYLLQELYPSLRHVAFQFRLHRRDMQQDTIHTTVLDTVYMAGVQAIRDRDYGQAITLLRPYADFNTAIAYCCLDYNASALSILERLERSAEVEYMLALLYARVGDENRALECYRSACEANRSFVHRGNLDPEISALIRKYGLNRES